MPNPTIITMKAGDLSPAFTMRLKNAAGYQNITGFTAITLRLTNLSTGAIIEGEPDVLDAAVGSISYQWVAGDTDVRGRYLIEVIVTFPETLPQTWPNEEIYYLVIK